MAATEVYYAIATSRLDAQMQQVDGLDTKVATVFTFASVVLAFFAGLLSITMLPNHGGLRVTDVVLVGVSIAVYGILVACIFKAYRVGDWSLRPNLEDLQKNCADYDDNTMRKWVADEMAPLSRTRSSRARSAFATGTATIRRG